MTYLRFLIIIFLCLSYSTISQVFGQSYPKLAPFPSLRWSPEVWLEGQWYVLRSINDLPVEDIRAFAMKKYDNSWQKRFAEDLVQVLSEMGHPPGKTVKLVVSDPKTGKEKTFDQVPMTAENRQSVRDLEGRIPSKDLKANDFLQALDEFQKLLNERWSYRYANQADLDAAIASLRKKIRTGMTTNDFGIELQKIIALGLDGHSDVTGFVFPSDTFLPCLVEPSSERFVAFKPDRTGFLAEGFPYLIKLDGKPISAWIEAASVLVPKGSPQYVRQNCLRQLRDFGYYRQQLQLPKKNVVELELLSTDGQSTKTITLPVSKQFPTYGEWPRKPSCCLDNNMGYLRLTTMNQRESVEEIKKWMPKFRDTTGLIVYVRDNGGGDRDALLWLYSYFANPEDPPHVFTAAAYRLHKEHPTNYLAQRFMYRMDAKEWNAGERAAVAKFATTFQPQGQPPKEQFSEWHFLALRRLNQLEIYHYPKPVIVLMNAKCFSATDIFLAGLKGMKNVTLIGTPSGGGSGLAQRFTLGNTPIRVRISSMVSFQANGKLFDGNGVQPDEIVEPSPEYFIGGTDNVLVEAIKRIQAK